jgi:hypothetical protein
MAREHGIPIWSGPSQTAARLTLLAEWLGASSSELSAVNWGIAAFWRLHYDHTTTTAHTVHEVMDIASNFGLPYSIQDPFATFDLATVRTVLNAFRTATSDLHSAVAQAGGAVSLPDELAAHVGDVLDQAARLAARPRISGSARHSASSPEHVEEARGLTSLTRTLQEASAEVLRLPVLKAGRPPGTRPGGTQRADSGRRRRGWPPAGSGAPAGGVRPSARRTGGARRRPCP